MSARRSVSEGRSTRAFGAGALALLLAACGADDEPDARFVVTDRDLRWTTDAAPRVYGVRTRFDGADVDVARAAAAWTSTGVVPARVDDGALRVEGLDAVGLRGPADVFVDPALHHALHVTAVLSGVDDVHLVLLGPDGPLHEPAPLAEARDLGDGRRTFEFPLSGLRGPREGRRAPFEVRFVGPRPRVAVEEIALVSEFDARDDADASTSVDASASAGTARRLLRGGALRRGDLLAAGRSATTSLPAGAPHRRLRVGLAAAGSDAVLHATLRATDERIPPRDVRLAASDGFLDLSVDLAPLDGDAAVFTLRLHDDAPSEAALLVGPTLLLERRTESRPAVILYVVDTLRADRLSLHGYERPTDPHLSAMARDGVVLEHVAAASSWTRPSISTLLTGTDPTRHGNRRHGLRIPDGTVTLAEAAAAAGYLTASFVTNHQAGAWSGLERGFDLHHEPSFAAADRIASSLTSSAVAAPLDALLAEHRDELLFVSVHTLDPHRPYAPPRDAFTTIVESASRPVLAGPDGRDVADESLAYDAEILHNDGMLARLDASLDALGMTENTLFVLLSDHGEAFGEHGQLEHRKTLFAEELHVPWVLRWPAGLPAGRRVDDWAGLVDVAPTLAGLLDIPAPDGWQGRNLAPLLRGHETRAPASPLLAELVQEDPSRAPLLAVMQAPYKLLVEARPEGLVPVGMYDVRADPGERVDLLDDPALGTPRAALLDWLARRLAAPSAAEPSTEADAAVRRWLSEMGYLHDVR